MLMALIRIFAFGMPESASSVAGQVDSIFNFILWVSVFFFVMIVGLMAIFLVRYRYREGVEPEDSPSHNIRLELLWSAIPLVLVLVMFVVGFKTFLNMDVLPGKSYEVQVTAQKWRWLFTYPNGYTDDVLHVPGDRPVSLIMRSEDVIHSFFVPAFRLKRDVVPGRYTKLWFTATETGEYPVYCAEYCGTSHSDMTTTIVVHESGEFAEWLENAANNLADLPPAEAGALVFNRGGCAACHSINGTASVGPTFQRLFGSMEALEGGGSVRVDENYILESIKDPAVRVTRGFQPVMPTYQGRFSDAELNYLVEYIKSLSEE